MAVLEAHDTKRYMHPNIGFANSTFGNSEFTVQCPPKCRGGQGRYAGKVAAHVKKAPGNCCSSKTQCYLGPIRSDILYEVPRPVSFVKVAGPKGHYTVGYRGEKWAGWSLFSALESRVEPSVCLAVGNCITWISRRRVCRWLLAKASRPLGLSCGSTLATSTVPDVH